MAQAIARTGGRAIAWVNQNRQLIATIFKVILAVTAAGIVIAAAGGALMTLGFVISFAASAIGGFLIVAKVIAGVFFLIISPAGLLIGALIALATYFLITSGVAEKALNWIKERFNSLKIESGCELESDRGQHWREVISQQLRRLCGHCSRWNGQRGQLFARAWWTSPKRSATHGLAPCMARLGIRHDHNRDLFRLGEHARWHAEGLERMDRHDRERPQ